MPPLQQQLWDKTLNVPLAGGFVHFFEDENRTVPKVVYELTGTGPGSYTYVSLGSVLTLSGIGTYVDSSGGNLQVYLWPYTGTPNDVPPSQTAQNYYITVYSSTGVFQFDVPDWPGVNSVAANAGENGSGNIISNGQFTDVNFIPSAVSQGSAIVFNTTGVNTVTEIAPDWSVVTNGMGSFSVWHVAIQDDTAPGNPAYALGITSTGYSQAIQLRQRILAPRILSNNYVSGTFIAETTGSSYTLTMNYTPSITGTIQQICTGATLTSGFTVIANSTPVLITDPGSGTGYVDISIVIPVNAVVLLSCVQLVSTPNMDTVIAYIEETPEREIDHLFHYFQPQLNFKPIPSYLVGWDFPLNPCFANRANDLSRTVPAPAAANAYTWDQTILFQSTISRIATSSDTDGSMVLTNSGGATQLALIQYLDIQTARVIFSNPLSVNIVAKSTQANLLGTVSIWYTTGNVPTLPLSVLTTLDANGYPSAVAAGWVEIPRQYGNAQFTLNSTFGSSGFNGWDASQTSVPANATFFAIIVGTASITDGKVLTFNSISVVPGYIPTIPAPQSIDEVMRECEFYYEKSYPADTPLGDTTTFGISQAEMLPVTASAGMHTALVTRQFGFRFNTVKRITGPVITFYSVVGTPGAVTGLIYNSGAQVNAGDIAIGNWTPVASKGTLGFTMTPANVTPLLDVASAFQATSEAFIQFQYTVDARPGAF